MLGADPPPERSRDTLDIGHRGDDVLLVGELAARERQRAIAVIRERRDPTIIDREGDLLPRVVGARDRDPLGREEDRWTSATPSELGPAGLERRRIARHTDRVGRSEDSPSLG